MASKGRIVIASKLMGVAALFLLPLAACGVGDEPDEEWLVWSGERPYQAIATDPRGAWVVIREEALDHEPGDVAGAKRPDARPMYLLRRGQDPTPIQGFIDATKDGDRVAVLQGRDLRLVETRTGAAHTLASGPDRHDVWADGNWVGQFESDDQVFLFAAPCEGGCRLGLANPGSGEQRLLEPVVEQFSDAAVAGSGRYVVAEVACLRPGDPRRGRQVRVAAPRNLTSARAPFRTCIVPCSGVLLVAEKDEGTLREVPGLIGVCDAGLVVGGAAGDLVLRSRGAEPQRLVERACEAGVIGVRPDGAVVARHGAGPHADWILVHRPDEATRVRSTRDMEVVFSRDTLVRSSSGWIRIDYREKERLYVDSTDAVVRRAFHGIMGAHDSRHILLRDEGHWFVWNRLHDTTPRPLRLPQGVRYYAFQGPWVAVGGVTMDITDPTRRFRYDGHGVAVSGDGRVLIVDEWSHPAGLYRPWSATGSMRWVRPR